MQFEVRALAVDRYDTLIVDALDAADARRIVEARQLQAVSVRPLGSHLARRSPAFELALFSQELAELLDAGLEVVEAVDTLAARENDGERARLCAFLVARLREGISFSAALEQAGDQFPPLYTGLIRAAEKTSDLHGALSRYLEYRSRFDALRAKITSALIYPAILISVGGAVCLFLLGYVVPRFATVYRGSGRNLPWLSQCMLDWGELIAGHRGLAGLCLLGTLLTGGSLLLHAWRQGRIEAALAHVPGVGRRIALFRLSLLYLTLGTLLNGGMPIVSALDLAEGVLPEPMRPRLRAMVAALRRGESISGALERHGLSTPVSLRLLRAGEGSGRIGEMFVRTARYHDGELARWLERFSKLFEPLLMTAIGVAVGVIVVLLYLPIFDLAGSLQ
ncbi:type II secretion system F family protein [Niveibacterium terrae]|uniref:type II secretion system F family protein n=1 Tax=Niveibacterium terrae TaxID=3373598 RepID=UPI003A8ED434